MPNCSSVSFGTGCLGDRAHPDTPSRPIRRICCMCTAHCYTDGQTSKIHVVPSKANTCSYRCYNRNGCFCNAYFQLSLCCTFPHFPAVLRRSKALIPGSCKCRTRNGNRRTLLCCTARQFVSDCRRGPSCIRRCLRRSHLILRGCTWGASSRLHTTKAGLSMAGDGSGKLAGLGGEGRGGRGTCAET